MAFELNSNGLDIQTQEEILAEIKADLQAAFGVNVNVTATSFFGMMANIMAEWRAAEQQVALNLYNSFDPAGAEGAALDQRAALMGTIRRGSTFSTIEGYVSGSGAAIIPTGSLIALDSNGSQWALIGNAINEPGEFYVTASFQAVVAGPQTALSNSDWSIVTVIPNWGSFTNPTEDASPGRLQESDGAFRQRRNVELYSENRGSLNSIAAVVSEVTGVNGYVDKVRVYHNPDQNPVDEYGIPFKAFNVVVKTNPSLVGNTGLQQDIADAILRTLGAGGEAYGTDYVLTAVDIEDQVQPIAFDEFTEVDVYVGITIQTAFYVAPFNNLPVVPVAPQQMANIIIEQVAEKAVEEMTEIGEDCLSFNLVSYVKDLVDSQQLRGINSISAGSNLVSLATAFDDITEIGIREIADYDTGRIIVNIDGADYTYVP